MADKLKLLNKDVLVKPILEQVTDSGIVLKTDFQPKTLKGKVIALAEHPECSELKVGDTVYFHKFAGKPLKLDNETYKIISIIDIEAVEV